MNVGNAKGDVVTNAGERELVITRIFDAPRELVWRAWTEPARLKRWWGPHGFTNPVCELTLRPGGSLRIDMRGPDGTIYPMAGVFHTIEEPERLVFTASALDEHGHSMFDVLTTVMFEELAGETRLTLSLRVTKTTPEAAPYLAGMEQGWTESLDRLRESLVECYDTRDEFEMTRVFDAPRDVVWKAWTDPQCLAQWWGPTGCTWVSGRLELRPGGAFHYCMQSPDGTTMWGKFVYREILPPERLVFVNSFSDERGGTTRHPLSPDWPLEVLSTVTFGEHRGKTTVTLRGRPINASELERKTFVAGRTSMEQGFGGTLDQLAAYLAKQRRRHQSDGETCERT